MGCNYRIVEASVLKEHEAVRDDYLQKLAEDIKKDGVIRLPILADEETGVILDGHHRYRALLLLGCKKIPVCYVNYMSDEVEVTLWPGAVVDTITKEEVIKMGLSPDVFPPKTTRHIVHFMIKEVNIPLENLM